MAQAQAMIKNNALQSELQPTEDVGDVNATNNGKCIIVICGAPIFIAFCDKSMS